MPTVAELETLLAPYAGNNETFIDRLNLVRARLLPMGNWRGSKQLVLLNVYSDYYGNAIVTPPREYNTILGGSIQQSTCSGRPLGVANEWYETLPYRRCSLTDEFVPVQGRYCVFRDWTDPLKLRFKFETTESSGTIHIRGTFDGEKVYSLYSSSWIEGERVAFSGASDVTSTKYFDSLNLSIVKPVTLGRVSMYTVDDDDEETLVAVYDPSETVPRWRRYKVPEVRDVVAISSSSSGGSSTDSGFTSSQHYTKDEIDAFFADIGTITVSSAGDTSLNYSAFFMHTAKIVVEAGSGAYTRNVVLGSTSKSGATFRIRLEIAQSANPTVRFYNGSTSGTLIQTVIGDSSNATYETHIFEFGSDSAWHWMGRET